MSFKEKSTHLHKGYISWVLVTLFFAFQYVLRVMPNVFMHDILIHFQIDLLNFGQFSGIYYIGYSIAHIPIGLALDRCGSKKVLIPMIFLAIIGTIPLLFSSWTMALIGRFLLGIASSAAILTVFKIVLANFEKRRFPTLVGTSVFFGLMGAIYGGKPLENLLYHFGYSTTLYILLFILGTMIVLCLLFFPSTPKEQKEHKTSIAYDFLHVLSNKKLIMFSVIGGLLAGSIEGFPDGWSGFFLTKVYAITTDAAFSLPSMIFLFMAFFTPVFGRMCEKYKKYEYVAIITFAVMITGIFGLLLNKMIPSSLLFLSFAAIGICCSYQILTLYKAIETVQSSLQALGSACANMILMLFGYAFHSIIGISMEYLTTKTTPDKAISLSLSIIPIASFIALILIFIARKQENKEFMKK